jgi:hypothetical protein
MAVILVPLTATRSGYFWSAAELASIGPVVILPIPNKAADPASVFRKDLLSIHSPVSGITNVPEVKNKSIGKITKFILISQKQF